MENKNAKLYFTNRNEQVFEVKPRTWKQIHKCLRSYMTENEVGKYNLIEGTQRISKMNGNVYADFINSETGDRHSFCIADYEDYINEIK